MRNFIIALVLANAQQSQQIIQLAQTYFSNVDNYLLNEHQSLPHITLVQVTLSEEKVSSLTPALVALNKALQLPSLLSIQLEPKLYAKPDGYHELRLAKQCLAEVQNLHETCKKRIEALGLTCQNASGHLYCPHLTLAKLHPTQPSPNIPASTWQQMELSLTCHLGFGVADMRWQLKEIYPEQLEILT